MCTAISLKTGQHYFGRNLDLEVSYSEAVTITPRNYPFTFRHKGCLKYHLAFIGVATVVDGYPLYYDATNEMGLSIAGLHFPEDTDYKPYASEKDNITPFEFIPWILCQCISVEEAESLLQNMNLLNENFSSELPLTPLHWIISDEHESIVVESVKEGLKIYPNPLGVLTNRPTFDIQQKNYHPYLAMEDVPGDWSSESRFIRAAFVKEHSICDETESASVSQFFHILDSVAHPRGCTPPKKGLYDVTVYSSCCNTNRGIFYYKTYENSQITAVDMFETDYNGSQCISYPFVKTQQIRWVE